MSAPEACVQEPLLPRISGMPGELPDRLADGWAMLERGKRLAKPAPDALMKDLKAPFESAMAECDRFPECPAEGPAEARERRAEVLSPNARMKQKPAVDQLFPRDESVSSKIGAREGGQRQPSPGLARLQ